MIKNGINQMYIFDKIESWIRVFLIYLTNYLPVKVIRNDEGKPFLYRYHIFKWGQNGPGLCIHRFVLSDPDRGYHDHPWKTAMSFILCGQYEERILNEERTAYSTRMRPRWTFNYLDGVKTFHRVMVEENKDVWTLFAFGSRTKTWGMVSIKDSKYQPMSEQVEDKDGDWANKAQKGIAVHSHMEHPGKVISTVDIVVLLNREKVLLIKRGKEPFKDTWAFPGGRIEQKDTDIMEAAQRELKEETHLQDVELVYYKTIGNNKRDPRGFCVTNIFIGSLKELPIGIKAGDDAIDYKWFDLNNLPLMAFDHKEILGEIIKEK